MSELLMGFSWKPAVRALTQTGCRWVTVGDRRPFRAAHGVRSVEICREIGNSAAMSPFVKREVMLGNLAEDALDEFRARCGINLLALDWHGKDGAMNRLSWTAGSRFTASTISA